MNSTGGWLFEMKIKTEIQIGPADLSVELVILILTTLSCVESMYCCISSWVVWVAGTGVYMGVPRLKAGDEKKRELLLRVLGRCMCRPFCSIAEWNYRVISKCGWGRTSKCVRETWAWWSLCTLPMYRINATFRDTAYCVNQIVGRLNREIGWYFFFFQFHFTCGKLC